MRTTLYRRNKMGVGTWSIWSEENIVIIEHAQVVGGSPIRHVEVVPKGLAGRSLAEQVASRVRSRVSRQRDKGYVDSEDQARHSPLLNTLDLPPPMLAKKLTDMRSWQESVVQKKLDGFRCMVAKTEDGETVAYSRQGKVLTALDHIAGRYHDFLQPGEIVDGEVYQHGVNLQTIASLAKRKQPGTEKLVHHPYDMVSEDPFRVRYDTLSQIVGRAGSECVDLVKCYAVETMDDVWRYFRQFRDEGYEGAMLRVVDSRYEPGHRSSGLLKVKERVDAEFECVKIREDKNGNALLTLMLPNGRTFDTSAPGSFDEKRKPLDDPFKYIGKQVTVEYAFLTNDGIPFHCAATGWREDL